MVTPKWVATPTQPIAVGDVVAYLAGVLEPPLQLGPDLRDRRAGRAAVLDHAVPGGRDREPPADPGTGAAAHPGLSSLWLSVVTDIDAATGRNLIDSMTNEVIVRDQSIGDLVPIQPLSVRRRGARGAA